MNPPNTSTMNPSYIFLYEDNFLAPTSLQERCVIRATNGADALQQAIALYQIPSALEVQLWSGPSGSTRHRIDTLSVLEGDILSAWIKVVKRTP
jgi:hypothetical protein